MKKFIITFTVLLFYSLSYTQTIEQLHKKKKYAEILKYSTKADNLTGNQLYILGFAYYQVKEYEKAVKYLDLAALRGIDSSYVHFYKGMSLQHLANYEEAIYELEIAIKLKPRNQEYLSEKGFTYYYKGDYEEALEIFIDAKKLPNKFQAPYYMVPRIHYMTKDYEKALPEYYEALENIEKDNPYYISTLKDIGQMEYIITKDYVKAAKAYSKAMAIVPNDFEIHPMLMNVYNAGAKYKKADSIFLIMKRFFESKELPESYMTNKEVEFYSYEWNGRKVMICRSFTDAKAPADISYKIYALNADGDVDRTFMVERTRPAEDGSIYVFCERDKKFGTHLTYAYNWKTDIVPLEDLKKAIGLALDGKMRYISASGIGR